MPGSPLQEPLKGICVSHDSSVDVVGMVGHEFEIAVNEG